tara:strand:- start:2174 stop:2557 length:384 start_codon:yes stop_codon:yes gene_type:complete
MNNIRYSLIEDNINRKVSYEDLKNNVDVEEQKYKEEKANFDEMDIYNNIIMEEQDYMDNYTRKELDRIADYYNISKRKKKKLKLIEDIVAFENDFLNEEIVNHRKLLWFYVEQIKCDNYLSKFLILD